jgi:hypothetical protein
VDPNKILNGWKNYFCQLLNVHRAGGVRRTEVHTAEPFVPDPSASEVEVAIGRLKMYRNAVLILIYFFNHKAPFLGHQKWYPV